MKKRRPHALLSPRLLGVKCQLLPAHRFGSTKTCLLRYVLQWIQNTSARFVVQCPLPVWYSSLVQNGTIVDGVRIRDMVRVTVGDRVKNWDKLHLWLWPWLWCLLDMVDQVVYFGLVIASSSLSTRICLSTCLLKYQINLKVAMYKTLTTVQQATFIR